MAKINVPVTCPGCNKTLQASLDIDPLVLAPTIRGGIRPVGIPYEYNVTSEDIKKFIIDTVHKYSPEAMVKVHTRYCEKKRRQGEPHRSYAFFKIAFSHHIIKDYSRGGWFQQIGESGEHVNIIHDVMENLIERWQYDRDYLNAWLKSYKKMEKLEDAFGMSDEFINDLKKFSTPRGIKVQGGNDIWVFFSASSEKILMDYFSNPDTNQLAGKLSVDNPTSVSKDIINYTIKLNPYQVETAINPHVEQILSNEEKV